jgi:UDPglucose 6-dehydrogenase
VRALVREGAIVSAYDPQATEKARAVLPDIEYCAGPSQAAKDADAIILATEWEEFKNLDWDELKKVVARPLVLDGRNMFQPADMAAHGFDYISVGRQPVSSMEVHSDRSGQDVLREVKVSPRPKLPATVKVERV